MSNTLTLLFAIFLFSCNTTSRKEDSNTTTKDQSTIDTHEEDLPQTTTVKQVVGT